MADDRTPENIPAALLAEADQLQARAEAEGPVVNALMDEAAADAAEHAAAGERTLGLDELAAVFRAELELEDLDGPEDLGGPGGRRA